MGWPRGNDTARLYKERAKGGGYIVVNTADGMDMRGMYDIIANVHPGPAPSLCGTSASAAYVRNRCRRVAWDELPADWQSAVAYWFRPDYWDCSPPESIRGFHRVGPRRRPS